MIILPLLLATLLLFVFHGFADPVNQRDSILLTSNPCVDTCFTQSVQAAGCGSLTNLSCVCNLDHNGPNYFGKTMACVVENCGANQSNITASYYFGTLCGGGGAPPPSQSPSSITTSVVATAHGPSSSSFTSSTTTTKAQGTSISSPTTSIRASTDPGSTLSSSDAHTSANPDTILASTHTVSLSITSVPDGASVPIPSNVTTASGPESPDTSMGASISSTSSIPSSIPKPTVLSSESHQRSIALTVSLPVVISLVLLAAIIIVLRIRARRRKSFNRTRMRGFGSPLPTSGAGYEEGDLGSLYRRQGHNAPLVTGPVPPTGFLRLGYREIAELAGKEAHGDAATLSASGGRNGYGRRATLDLSSEPHKSSNGAHDGERSIRESRASALWRANQDTECRADTRNDTDMLLQGERRMVIRPEPQPIDVAQRYSSHPHPEPVDGAGGGKTTQLGPEEQAQGDTEPRLLRLVLPWAFGQHILSLVAANPPRDGVAPQAVGDEATEPPPAYHLLSPRGSRE
ncbi:hypothetical protein GY45DRAFT_1437837 [Cubamyces sp. BRFM 1775]|nr:hypothetical protein GY45DRAFT_1437837 [Cubamyces sp. BRFM 1775]